MTTRPRLITLWLWYYFFSLSVDLLKMFERKGQGTGNRKGQRRGHRFSGKLIEKNSAIFFLQFRDDMVIYCWKVVVFVLYFLFHRKYWVLQLQQTFTVGSPLKTLSFRFKSIKHDLKLAVICLWRLFLWGYLAISPENYLNW